MVTTYTGYYSVAILIAITVTTSADHFSTDQSNFQVSTILLILITILKCPLVTLGTKLATSSLQCVDLLDIQEKNF